MFQKRSTAEKAGTNHPSGKDRPNTFTTSFIKILIGFVIVALQTGCLVGASSTPTNDTDLSLTEIVQQVEVLKLELTRVAPTLAEINANNPTPITPGDSVNATDESIPKAPGQNTPEPVVPTAAILTEAPAPTATFTPIPAPVTGEVVYQDNFNMDSGWFVEKTDRYTLQYRGGGYRVYSRTKNNPIWSVRNRQWDDVIIEADVMTTIGPDDSYYGLVCRYQNGKQYYMLVASLGGEFEILRVEGSELVSLAKTSGLASVLRPDQNHLRADCIGDQLILYVNDQKVVETKDSQYTSGGAGLAAGNRSKIGVDVIFDNFVVKVP
jgi:hypothetical protein